MDGAFYVFGNGDKIVSIWAPIPLQLENKVFNYGFGGGEGGLCHLNIHWPCLKEQKVWFRV